MVGNDIVDLLDPDVRPESFRPRFDERVFSAEERRLIARDPDSLARRWAHWGAKEAAYKLARQVDSSFVFSPSSLVANFAAPRVGADLGGARHERRGELRLPRLLANGVQTLELRSFETPELIHVVAVPEGCDWGGVDLGVQRIDSERHDASAAVRSLAIREIGRSLGVDGARLAIGREGRIPTIELDGERTSLSLSLSHHGDWIGYAMRLHVEARHRSGSSDAWQDAPSRLAQRGWTE